MSEPTDRRASFGLALADDTARPATAILAEQLGYRALWVPGGQLRSLDLLTDLLAATNRAELAPAIISPDVHSAPDVADLYRHADTIASGRLTIGVSNGQRQPSLADFVEYLDKLQSLGVPTERTLIAALGPRKLELARDRGAGAITLLVTPRHTERARAVLGPRRRLVVDQFVVLDDDPHRARAAAREPLRFLSKVGGYRANFDRMGFTGDDVAHLSDRLVDALVAWGDEATIRRRLHEHAAAGADHIAISPIATSASDAVRVATVFAPARVTLRV